MEKIFKFFKQLFCKHTFIRMRTHKAAYYMEYDKCTKCKVKINQVFVNF